MAVAAISAGALAVLTYVVSSEYRWRSFESMSREEVSVALSLAPERLDESSFERLLKIYEKRSGTDAVAVVDGEAYSSSALLDADDVPTEIRSADGEVTTARAHHDGLGYLVVGGPGPGGARYAFFFSLAQLEASLDELKVILGGGWFVVVAGAAGAGQLVARRTLRPVREAAAAATSLASGLLETRLESTGDDEFSAWAESFNEMADALESKIEALSRSAERERRFTADVAHDLRTPLTGMTVTASLLEAKLDELPPESQRAARVLVRDVVRLKDLVLDLLELARLDSGHEAVAAERLEVSDALRAAVESVKLDGIDRVQTSVEPNLTVTADRARFRRIVANVVGNALTHGDGEVNIDARGEGDQVLVTVSDHGPGIDLAHAERVFDRFYKSDDSRSHGGSGLGLGIARDHARLQGGDVYLADAEAPGTCVVIRLPRGRANGDATVTER